MMPTWEGQVTRALNSVQNAGMYTLGHLRSAAAANQLWVLKNVGPGTERLLRYVVERNEGMPDHVITRNAFHTAFPRPSRGVVSAVGNEEKTGRNTDIIVRWAAGERPVELARAYGVSSERIRQILHRARTRAADLKTEQKQ